MNVARLSVVVQYNKDEKGSYYVDLRPSSPGCKRGLDVYRDPQRNHFWDNRLIERVCSENR